MAGHDPALPVRQGAIYVLGVAGDDGVTARELLELRKDADVAEVVSAAQGRVTSRLAALEKGSPAEAAPVTSQSDDAPVRFSGPQLRRLRKRLGLTLHQFATLLDVSAASISNWEAGRSRPRDMGRIVAARKLSRP